MRKDNTPSPALKHFKTNSKPQPDAPDHFTAERIAEAFPELQAMIGLKGIQSRISGQSEQADA